MEYDKVDDNGKLFFFGIICLVISLGLFFFSLYILPYFLWEWAYDVPDFILSLLAKYEDDYHYTSAGAKTAVWLIFFIPCVITGLISYFVSRRLDKQMYEPTPTEEQEKPTGELQREIKESASLGGKILGLMILIIVLVFLLQYFVQATA